MMGGANAPSTLGSLTSGRAFVASSRNTHLAPPLSSISFFLSSSGGWVPSVESERYTSQSLHEHLSTHRTYSQNLLTEPTHVQ
jgi:hypothetical protein